MVDEEQRLRRDPALKGVPNPYEPGEPEANLPVSDPVPNTGHTQREEHMQEHDSYANSPKDFGEGKHNHHEEKRG